MLARITGGLFLRTALLQRPGPLQQLQKISHGSIQRLRRDLSLLECGSKMRPRRCEGRIHIVTDQLAMKLQRDKISLLSRAALEQL